MMHAPTPDGADCGGQALCVDVAETATSHTPITPPCIAMPSHRHAMPRCRTRKQTASKGRRRGRSERERRRQAPEAKRPDEADSQIAGRGREQKEAASFHFT